MEATLPVERSRMPSGRLMPPQKSTASTPCAQHFARHDSTTALPIALFAGREAGGQASCPYPCTRPSSSALSDFNGPAGAPCSRPRPAQHTCRPRTDRSLCLALRGRRSNAHGSSAPQLGSGAGIGCTAACAAAPGVWVGWVIVGTAGSASRYLWARALAACCASLPVACVLSVHADCRRLRRPVGRFVGRGWTGTAAVLSHGVGRPRDSCCARRCEESKHSASQVAADRAWSGRSAGEACGRRGPLRWVWWSGGGLAVGWGALGVCWARWRALLAC